ncbi:hypothetical protein TRVA0_001S03466 [Trichomonascus vanleenenianus]|uniref:Gfo/Idh/MocA family protein n=1 Tax=Trichomonascus vanleenenianus TaxID=2268995 RepID=UPI003ECA09C7
MTVTPIRILSVGAGSRARAYTRSLRHSDFVQIRGIADISEPRRNKLKKYVESNYTNAAAAPIKLYGDWREALKDVDDYDAVMICVLDEMHRDVAVAFADAGKHLLCEKPLATNWQHCQEIYDAVMRNNVILAIGHVLRYSPHNIELKKLLDQNIVGDIININHTEPVGWFHFAHSYVRGNWRREDQTSFALMTKCCHDIDFLLWILGPQNLKRISSFGNLSHFKKANKPAEAGDATRCFDCPAEENCGFSAKKVYYNDFVAGKRAWKLKTVTDIEDEPHLKQALMDGPYGKCVYECDNDVCDNQTVNLDFGNASATMTMIAFSEALCERKICIYGTKGEISTNSTTIKIFNFATRETTIVTPSVDEESGHGGGDRGLAEAFAKAVRDVVVNGCGVDETQAKYINCTPSDALASHRAVFLAEKSRHEGTVLDVTTAVL